MTRTINLNLLSGSVLLLAAVFFAVARSSSPSSATAVDAAAPAPNVRATRTNRIHAADQLARNTTKPRTRNVARQASESKSARASNETRDCLADLSKHPQISQSLVAARRRPFLAVDSGLIGNSLPASDGSRVFVLASRQIPSELSAELELTHSPPEPAPSLILPEEAQNSDLTQTTGSAAHGFTYEQELFRTKWGWAAFSRAQAEAAGHHTSPSP
ncbi:MAG: hypothetical protein Q8Q59_08125 [Luteolibacter sp.]|jgi:hypothetical protein|nr:hypothetical protein [Luteolibacter sp.]